MKKILIANRGEITVRIIRSCREENIKTVAIFSDADRISPHVLMADEAYRIGSSPAHKSYLRIDSILEIAKQSGADAVHPGYGFLSENFKFAEAIINAGLTWIGPPPDAMSLLGDKVAARKIAEEVGVPVIPGAGKHIKKIGDVLKTAEEIGYPVLIKAVGGGGGKGMRIVTKKSELQSAFERSRSEAASAFGDDRIFIEKYFASPHHIEIQISADTHGNVVAFPERECSIQRRYQKIIEESPSPYIDRPLWENMAEAARKICLKTNYQSVGTVEFLVDNSRNFYFLEMNTRLQVEHPVTEEITGIDLVREQIRIAAGEKLSLKQDDININGHSIECRIYAEDGFRDFIPSVGTIHELTLPEGPGIRFDHGMRAGMEITPYYDPLLGKLIVHDKTRNMSLRRMERALRECSISGIATTVPFCSAVIKHLQFREGNYTTSFVADEMDNLRSSGKDDRSLLIAAAAAALHSYRIHSSSVHNSDNGTHPLWKQTGRRENLR